MSARRPHQIVNANGTSQETLEEENRLLEEQMAHKVAMLKSLSIDMGDEVRGHNKLLGTMNSEFDDAGGLLSSSMKRVKAMSLAGHNRWMFMLILFILFVCFVLYYLIRWR
ncbi:hypothetical protein EMCRGX_G023743 [Ephydatia muelleri]|eukprot:Em0017g17a